MLEVALHKAHELKFPLARIVDGLGAAPLSPPHPDFVEAMGRTNDAIIYGGLTHLFVTGPADDAKALREALPSSTSRDYGRPFAEIFKACKGDFYAIDPMLFSPARGDRDGGRDRRDVPRRKNRRRPARRLFRLSSQRPDRRRRPQTPSRSIFTTGTRGIFARPFPARARSRRRSASPIAPSTPRRPSGLVMPGFGVDLPDAVFVRAIGSGTFEAVTLRLDVLHGARRHRRAGRQFGPRGRNLRRQGGDQFLPSPAPACRRRRPGPCNRSRRRAKIVRREAARGPLVLKPLFGAQGFGLKLIAREADLPDLWEVSGAYYLQRFVGREDKGYADMRFFVSGGEVIAAMTRRSAHWITNVKLGARPEWLDPTPSMVDLALRAAAAAGADFAGVDMIYDVNGAPLILEVNSMPGWRGLQKVAPFSIADRLARDFLARIGAAPEKGAIPAATETVE